MRKIIIIPLILAVSAAGSDSGRLRFPAVSRNGANAVNAATAWQVAKRVTPQIDGQGIYSFRYHSDGKSVIIGTTDFDIFRINLETGQQIWKVSAKMKYQKEFDGPDIFDVSPDGKYFLSIGQSKPDVQASERFLVVRSASDGSVVKNFAVEQSTFWSKRAEKDHRYPGAAAAKERLDAGIGFYWLLSIDSARFAEGGKRIVASYKNNMEGANLYDRRLMLYESTGRKIGDMQVVADKETANWEQPAGFEIGHLQLPYLYNAQRKSLIFGTAHGRVHEIDAATMAKNQKTPLVEDKPAGNVIFTPLSSSADMQIKDRQTCRYLAESPDGKTLFVAAGFEGGYVQLYAFEAAGRKEIFHSTLFDAGRLLAPANDILVVGGIFSGAKFLIADVKAGKLVFVTADYGDNYVNPAIFDTNPVAREVAGLGSGNVLLLIRPL